MHQYGRPAPTQNHFSFMEYLTGEFFYYSQIISSQVPNYLMLFDWLISGYLRCPGTLVEKHCTTSFLDTCIEFTYDAGQGFL